MEGTVVCPVCTLYLRPGMTLKSHLESHPKQKVIEALVKLHSEPSKEEPLLDTATPSDEQLQQQQQGPGWMGGPHGQNGVPMAQTGPGPGNHSFFYQQFMSSSTPQQPGYVNQQYVTIPIFNQQMLPPYMYHQQQQVFVTSGPSLPRLMPISAVGQGQEPPQQLQQPDAPNIVEIHEDAEVESTESVDLGIEERPKGSLIRCNDEDGLSDDGSFNSDLDKEILQHEDDPEEKEDDMPHLENQVTYVDGVEDYGGADVIIPNAIPDAVDLMNKSCQTHPDAENVGQPPDLQPEVHLESSEEEKLHMEVEAGPKYITLTSHADQGGEHQGDGDHHNFDMDGMNLILGQEFMQAAPIEDFDYSASGNNNKYGRPRILMNIGEFADNRDENLSIDSANMRADENMPPRGELSGQESNASDVASWSRLQYNEGSSRMSTGMSSYDLLARESWEGSDASDVDAPPPYQSRNPPFDEDDDPILISGSSRQGIEYKCASCELSFVCPKERRVHQTQVHRAQSPQDGGTSTTKTEDNDAAVIGSQLFKKKVKKLVIKPKQTQQAILKTEKIEDSPFDHIFNNILKIEDDTKPTSKGTSTITTANGLGRVGLVASDAKLLEAAQPVIICVICCTIVRDTSTLKQHQVAVHDFKPDTKYKCGVCHDAFACEPQYTEHLTVHPLECQYCGKYFYRAHNMQLHIKRHMGVRPFKCINCDKMFLTRQKLQEHRHTHTGEAPLKCNMCNETFKRHSNLIQHRNRHHLMVKKKVKDFICSTCGEIFHSKKKLAWHKEIHENKPKSCVYCSEKFMHASSLTRHVRRAHNERFVPEVERDRENVECPICKGVYLRTSLETHIKNHTGSKNYTCSVCDKDFTTKWNLKLHKWTHAGRAQKPYKCELCKGAFVRESDYTAHMNSHKSIRPYTCNHCGAQFIRKYNCQRHVKEHERVKTFTCTICNKTFHRSYYLNDHMRIHSGIRPFSCHICGKTSTTKSNHNKHVRIHHAREPVSTEN